MSGKLEEAVFPSDTVENMKAKHDKANGMSPKNLVEPLLQAGMMTSLHENSKATSKSADAVSKNARTVQKNTNASFDSVRKDGKAKYDSTVNERENLREKVEDVRSHLDDLEAESQSMSM